MRGTGIEPVLTGVFNVISWKPAVLPLNQPRLKISLKKEF